VTKIERVCKEWTFKTRTILVGLAVTAMVAIAAACGGSSGGDPAPPETNATADGPSASDAPQAPDVVVDLTLELVRFVPDAIDIRAGQLVQINMRNLDGVEHDFQVQGLSVELMGDEAMRGHHAGAGANMLAMHATENGNASVMFRAEQRGTYEFFCTIEGHRDAGETPSS
jgi:uncharacterized cupredoxin-like copper-binding protein